MAEIILHYLLVSVVAGLVGAGAMSLVVICCSRMIESSVSMVVAIGSIVTRSEQSARPVGILMHIVSGIAFGMLYTYLYVLLNPPSHFVIPVGALLGTLHGFVVFFLLIPTFAEHSPIKEVRRTGPAMSIAYVAAHIVYGVFVGISVLMSGLLAT